MTKAQLLNAAEEGRLDDAKRLLAYQVPVKDGEQRTPLLLATIGSHLDVTQCLIEHGASVNAVDKERTPLIWSGVNASTPLSSFRLIVELMSTKPTKTFELLYFERLRTDTTVQLKH